MKLLLVKTSSMGDVIHAMPALTDALRARPDLVVDWAVEAPFAPIVALHPGVRQVLPVRLREWRRRPFSAAVRGEVRALRQRLRAERYDLVLDAQGLIKSAWLARLAGAPIAGFDRASAREGLACWVYRHRHAVPRGLHAVERQRRLFGLALGYTPELTTLDYGLRAPAADRTDAAAAPDAHAPQAPGAEAPAARPAQPTAPPPTALLLHGTNWPSKRWTREGWAGLARRLADQGLQPVLTWSNADEEALARAVAAEVPAARLLPRSGLDRVAGEIARAELVVGCDTGLTHLAAAFGRPTVALFLSTQPGLTGPVGRQCSTLQATLGCAPCLKRDCPKVPAGTPQPCTAALPLERLPAAAAAQPGAGPA